MRSTKGLKRTIKRLNMQAKLDEFVKEFERRHGDNMTLRDVTPRNGRHIRDFHMERWARGLVR